MQSENETPAERLKKVMEDLSISKEELSKALGISGLRLHKTYKIRKVYALAIQAVYGINANWILHNEPPVFSKKEHFCLGKEEEEGLEENAMKIATTFSTLSKKKQGVVKTIINSLDKEHHTRGLV